MDVYIVVTEEWYGGGEKTARTFDTLEKAKKYQETLINISKNKLDVAILKCRMNDPDFECERIADEPSEEPEYCDE